MAVQKYIVFDFGATSGRGILFSYNGNTLAMNEIHRFDNHPVTTSGTLYWNILALYNELTVGLKKACVGENKIQSVGIDSWGIDCGFIDKNGKLIANPVAYRDIRRSEVREEVFSIIPEHDLFRRTGLFLYPIMGLFHLYALKIDNSPELQCGSRYLMMPDLFNYFLTGNTFNEYTNATLSLLLNVKSKTWDSCIMEKLHLPEEIFCDILLPGSEIGPIQQPVAEELGIPEIPVFAVGSHDTASAIAGIPVSGEGRNWAYLSLGTYAAIGMETPEPVLSDEVMELGIGNPGSVEGKTFIQRNITGMYVLEECKRIWERQLKRQLNWEEILSQVDMKANLNIFINLDDPVFGQIHHNMIEVIIKNIDDQGVSIENSIGAITQIILKSLAMKIRECFEHLSGLTNKNLDTLHIIGGGSQNKLLCQWIANSMNIPVIAGPSETTSIGNALMQLKGTGEIASLNEGRQIVLSSLTPEVYTPESIKEWNDIYGRYLKQIC